jgi:hypothetical protein
LPSMAAHWPDHSWRIPIYGKVSIDQFYQTQVLYLSSNTIDMMNYKNLPLSNRNDSVLEKL